jgi:hypothetical protein
LTRCGASREKTQAQQSQKYHLLSQAQAPKALFSVHDFSLPKGLIGAFKYLEPPQGKLLRLLSFREKKRRRYSEVMQLIWQLKLGVFFPPFLKGVQGGLNKCQ